MKSLRDKVNDGLSRSVEVGDCLEWRNKMGNNKTVPVVTSRHEKTYSAEYSVPRELWLEHRGPIPDGKIVYRTCCNNACVALAHLAIGTRKDWQDNRKANGLTKHSATHVAAITKAARNRQMTINSLEKAREVRSMLGEYSRSEIARLTGVSEAMVSDIARHRAWKDHASPFQGLMR